MRLTDLLTFRHEADKASAHLPSLMMQAEKVANGILHGDHALRKSGMGEKFWQFREYLPGDRPQDIDWRQSAKTDQIFIRQKEWQIAQKTFFWCSSGDGMAYSSAKTLPQKLNTARVITLALAILMARANEQVGLFGDPKTGRSDLQLQRIAQSLIAEPLKPESLPAADFFPLPQNSSLILCGDFLEPLSHIEENFDFLSASGQNSLVIQVLDPQELELNFQGRVTFQGLTRVERETVNNVGSIQEAYRKRMHDHMKALYALCAERNWSYILHRTDQSVSDTVLGIWLLIGAARHGGRQ